MINPDLSVYWCIFNLGFLISRFKFHNHRTQTIIATDNGNVRLLDPITCFLEARSRYFSARLCKVLPNSSFCANNRIDIMRWRGVFHVFNAKLSCNGRTNLIHIQTYAFNLRRTNHIVCQVLCHCAQFAVKSQRTQPAIKQALLTGYLLLKE